ncbi:MAG: SspB family protein [Pseudomonadota bacterium]|nr:SspB family protein [Pseudomonadota bacterium]MDQ2704271.1 SspB family protein [Pseudomonadota bacterium]
MAEDHIRYDILAQEALRGVMRKVLAEVARTGLPGNHHFFITFLTGAPGVRISSRLREKYPEQMTIVIQFQYWDLKVTDTGFEIGLSFSDVPERLEIPFSAVRGFYDPSVNFELEFDVKTEAPAEAEAKPEKKAEASATPVKKADSKKKSAEAAKEPAADPPSGAKSADVVSLDAFRKK